VAVSALAFGFGEGFAYRVLRNIGPDLLNHSALMLAARAPGTF
jgi:hypothetical protein